MTGNLQDWDVMPRLSEIDVPTLFLTGRYDEIPPRHMHDEHERVKGSEYILFENTATCRSNRNASAAWLRSTTSSTAARHDDPAGFERRMKAVLLGASQ